ncbi:MAG TPA: HAD-IIA family hydrolase [Deinococcales bacterium]|nr:HAD-IIA family hydrolase [Deinococcales bacterium]
MSRLDRLETFFFDLDGCIWFGDELAPNAARLVARLRASGKRVAFVTNVSSATAGAVAGKLERLGIPAVAEDVMTPLTVLDRHRLLEGNPEVFLLGNEAIRATLTEAGFRLTADPEAARVVIASRDTGLTYSQLAEAATALFSGAELLALNLDARVPVTGGKYVPGNGAIVAALTTATGVTAEALGKPSEFYYAQALRRFSAAPATTAMIGDNLDSDIAGGNAADLLTIQVGGDTYSQREPAPVPDHSVADLHGLEQLLTGTAALAQQVQAGP